VFNFATSLKEPKFLDFFFRQLRVNDLGKYLPTYQYLSPCGREMNFVRAADTGVVFNRMEGESLVYAHNLRMSFQPSKLKISSEGRVYHPSPVGADALIASNVVQQVLQHNIRITDSGYVLVHGDKEFGIEEREDVH